ncbi:MAG: hypothetical protein HS104_11785 [Polyangiaceae bacterium]|nr:hypothetical protein [Polyangiaceae bacterium]MCL4748540.1 hypothetical protein [Myxococcales bacterium]
MILSTWAISTIMAGCAVSDPPLIGSPKQPHESGEQAEVHAVVARRLNGSVNLVVGHRFTGPNFMNNVAGNPKDITYDQSLPGGVSFRRGSSINGWSYSANGASWQAPGKVYPQFVWGEPVAILWSDPALAVGLTNPSLVAYASLAVSRQAFDSVAGTSQTSLNGWPTTLTTPDGINLVDSVCVALSFDGGVQFGDLTCIREPDIGDYGTDQTTVAIGAGGRVFVAADDFRTSTTLGRLLLYELVYTGASEPFLQKLPVDADMETYSRSPELRRDQSGVVWLSGMNDAGTVRLCQVTSDGCTYIGQVTTGAKVFASLPAGVVTDKKLRSGVSADFAVNRTQLAGSTVREFIFVYSRVEPGGDPDASRTYVGVTRCFRFGLEGVLSCQDIDAWGARLRAGYQTQPRIEFVDKSPGQDGSGADWRYAFYEFGRDEIAQGHAQVTLATLYGTLPSAADPTVVFSPLPGPDPEVCPAYYEWQNAHYWGDYFALLAVPPVPGNANWRHLAIYSSDEQRGCVPSHPLQGRNLHVVAWGWVD